MKVALTRAEVQRLRSLAEADLRWVGSFVTWLVAQELASSTARNSKRTRGASPRDPRAPYSVLLTMPTAMRGKLEAAARREMRSISGYVGRVVLEALASR